METLQERFVQYLPEEEAYAERVFRYKRCQDSRADLVAEAMAYAWDDWRRLSERGVDPVPIRRAITIYACKPVRAGRPFAGGKRATGVLSWVAQGSGGFQTVPICHLSGAIVDGVRKFIAALDAPVPDVVAVVLDYADWRRRVWGRSLDFLEAFERGENHQSDARALGVDPAYFGKTRRALGESCAAAMNR